MADASVVREDVAMILLPQAGLPEVLKTLGPMLRGQEAARRSYHEHADGPGARQIPARTDSFRRTLAWWKMCCRIVGLDDDLSNW